MGDAITHADRQTGMMKLMEAFRDYSNAPNMKMNRLFS